MASIFPAMRLPNGLLASTFAALVLAACQGTEAPEDPGLKARVDTSIMQAAQASEARGDFASAARYYGSIYERDPENVEVAVGLSRNLRYVQRPREAEAIMDRALREAPQDPALLAERGKVHLANREAPQAVDVLSRAALANDRDWEVEAALGVGFDRMALYDEADRHYRRALALAPDNPIVLNNYGLSLAQRGDLTGAVETLRRAASQPNANATIRQNLALMYALSGDLARAEELVRRDLSPEMAERNMAHYRQLAANRNRADAAAATLEAAERQGLGGAPTVDAAPVARVEAQPVAPATPKTAVVAAQPAEPKTAMTDAARPAEPDAETPSAEAEAETAGMREATTDDAMPAEAKAAKPAREAGAGPQAAASTRAPAATGAKPERIYMLQLASFRREAQAEQARALLTSEHKEVLGEVALAVSHITLGERGDYYRVMSDPLADRAAAADLCRVLKTRNADCLLVRTDRQ